MPQEEVMPSFAEKMSDPEIKELSIRVESLESEINRICERNFRVEMDKAWEASSVRVIFLVGLTYLITSIVFWFIAVPNPLLNALIPTIGYYLSTLSLPVVKEWWVKNRNS